MKGLTVIVLLVALTVPLSSVYANSTTLPGPPHHELRADEAMQIIMKNLGPVKFVLFGSFDSNSLIGWNKTGSFSYQNIAVTYTQTVYYHYQQPSGPDIPQDFSIQLTYESGPLCSLVPPLNPVVGIWPHCSGMVLVVSGTSLGNLGWDSMVEYTDAYFLLPNMDYFLFYVTNAAPH